MTNKNYNIDSYSYGDQTDSESDDWEHFSDFEDSELIFHSSDDDWIPYVVIHHCDLNVIWNLQNQINGKVETDNFSNCLQNQLSRYV